MNRNKRYRQTFTSVGLASLAVPAAQAEAPEPDNGAKSSPGDAPMIDVLRLDHTYTLAQHRSHSSHRSHQSHRSHRSSSGGGSRRPAPAYTPPSRNENSSPESSVLPSSPYVALRQQPIEFEEHVEVVQKVQAKLWVQKHFSGSIDGVAGPETKAAISKYQSARSTAVTGRITKELLAALEIDVSPIFDEATYLKTLPGNSAKFKRIVQEVQVILFVYGYYSGVIDGVVGSQTSEAIREFQIDYGIGPTGTLTPETLTALHVTAN